MLESVHVTLCNTLLQYVMVVISAYTFPRINDNTYVHAQKQKKYYEFSN